MPILCIDEALWEFGVFIWGKGKWKDAAIYGIRLQT